MISLSPAATEQLMHLLRASEAGPGEGFRLEPFDTRLRLRLDIPLSSDRVTKVKGQNVLIVSRECERVVGDAMIELQEEELFLKK